MSRTKIITTEDIWKLTSGGEMVFERELEKIDYNKNVRSPFRTDSNPSLKLNKATSGIVYFNDFGGNQLQGNALDLLQHLYGLTFQQAIDKIWNDFKGNKTNLSRKTFEKKEVKPKQPKLIEFQECKFSDKHIKYFEPLGLGETYLNSKNVFAVCKFAIDKKVINIPEHQYVFAYYAPDIDKCKLLTLGKDVKIKWLTSCSNDYLWFYHEFKEPVDTLWVCKSVKDALVLSKNYNFNTVSLQNESAKIFLENNVEKVESIAKNIVIYLGTDPQGKEQSIEITKARGYKWFNIPNNMFDSFSIEDGSDYIKEFGINSFSNLLKKKGWL
jgi:hypothetical protein